MTSSSYTYVTSSYTYVTSSYHIGDTTLTHDLTTEKTPDHLNHQHLIIIHICHIIIHICHIIIHICHIIIHICHVITSTINTATREECRRDGVGVAE